jgi:small subunit ribosomal protein S16
VEDLGSYNPFTKTSSLNKERISYWIKMGAQPTVSVHNLLVEQNVVTGTKVAVKMNKPEAKAPEAAAPAAAAEPAAVAPAVSEAPEATAEAKAADATETAPEA